MMWIAHLICFIFFIPGLFVTIPVHMLLSFTDDLKALAGRKDK